MIWPATTAQHAARMHQFRRFALLRCSKQLTGKGKNFYNPVAVLCDLAEGLEVSVSQQQTSKPIFRVVMLQALLVLAIASMATFFADGLKGASAAVGGMIAVIGSLLYALLVSGKTGDAASVMKAHFVAEMMKIFITIVLFALALLLFHSASMVWLIAGFAAATLAYWLALLFV